MNAEIDGTLKILSAYFLFVPVCSYWASPNCWGIKSLAVYLTIMSSLSIDKGVWGIFSVFAHFIDVSQIYFFVSVLLGQQCAKVIASGVLYVLSLQLLPTLLTPFLSRQTSFLCSLTCVEFCSFSFTHILSL